MRNLPLRYDLYKFTGAFLGGLVWIAGLFAVSSAVSAEDEPRRGLLADGRAFRTDENGNQLVDYIAELEVNVEALEKRVFGLEDDLKEKEVLIRRLQNGATGASALQEHDLVTQAVSQHRSQRQPEKTAECPAAMESPEKIATLEQDLREARARTERASEELSAERAHWEQQREESIRRAQEFEIQLAQVRAELRSERDNRSREVASYENALRQVEEPSKVSLQQIAILRKNIDESRQQLATEQASRRSIEERSQRLLAEKQAEIETLRTERSNSAAQNQGMLTKLTAAQQLALQQKQQEIDKLQERLTDMQVTQVRAQQRQDSAQRASLAEVSRDVGMVAAQPPSTLIGARERAVAELRSQVSGALAQLTMSVQARDELFAHFDQRGRALQIRPSVLRAASGATPDSIRSELQGATSVRDLLKLRDDVHFISLKVADDIATVRRLSGGQR